MDRLLALILGLRYRQVVTLRGARIFAILSWLLSLIIATIFLYNFRIAIIIICIVLLSCTVVTTFCYTKIYLRLRRHQAQVQVNVQGQPNRGRGGMLLNKARYRKTVSSALWDQKILVVCYLPYAIVAILVITRSHSQFLKLAYETAVSLGILVSLLMLNSTLNQFLYC